MEYIVKQLLGFLTAVVLLLGVAHHAKADEQDIYHGIALASTTILQSCDANGYFDMIVYTDDGKQETVRYACVRVDKEVDKLSNES